MARTYDELEAWQLANQLKLGVYTLTETGSVTRDFRFREQLRDAAASGPSNIAEGFGRYKPAQFRQSLDVAIASLTETSNDLLDGVDRKHFTRADIGPLLRLVARAGRFHRTEGVSERRDAARPSYSPRPSASEPNMKLKRRRAS